MELTVFIAWKARCPRSAASWHPQKGLRRWKTSLCPSKQVPCRVAGESKMERGGRERGRGGGGAGTTAEVTPISYPLFWVQFPHMGMVLGVVLGILLGQAQVAPQQLLGLLPGEGDQCPLTSGRPPAASPPTLDTAEAVSAPMHHSAELGLTCRCIELHRM